MQLFCLGLRMCIELAALLFLQAFGKFEVAKLELLGFFVAF